MVKSLGINIVNFLSEGTWFALWLGFSGLGYFVTFATLECLEEHHRKLGLGKVGHLLPWFLQVPKLREMELKSLHWNFGGVFSIYSACSIIILL